MKYESSNTSHVLSAIDEARQSFLTLNKSGKNSFFKSRSGEPHAYSTLSDIFDATMESLYQHKLSVNYQTRIMETSSGTTNVLTTTITHLPSGEFIASVSELGRNLKSQELGSAITYMRRYHIQAMLNLEADFEDDGNLASGNKNQDGKGNDIEPKVTMPVRKYIQYDKEGYPATEVTNFQTYLKSLSEKTMKQHHAWCSQTIVHLKNIIDWANGLEDKYNKGAQLTIKKCNEKIKAIGEGNHEF